MRVPSSTRPRVRYRVSENTYLYKSTMRSLLLFNKRRFHVPRNVPTLYRFFFFFFQNRLFILNSEQVRRTIYFQTKTKQLLISV